jgi:hypothetical protein
LVKRGVFFYMKHTDTLMQVADTVTDAPIKVTVDVKPQNRMHALMQRIGLKPKVKVFQLQQITFGNLIRISKILVGIDGDIMTIIKDGYKSIDAYGPFLSRIVAIALHNKKSWPPDSLSDFIDTNITSAEMADIFAVILKQMNVQGFLNSIILIKGVNVLEMSRDLMGSSIAPGPQSVAS